MTKNKILLNAEQKAAVLWNKSPLCVTATAGSGKTRVIISKIISLIENIHVNSSQICAFTFTNKASREMQKRLFEQFRDHRVTVTTFHKFCYVLLLKAITQSDYNYKTPFRIVSNEDQTNFLKKLVLKENPISDQQDLKEEVAHLNNQISLIQANKLQYEYRAAEWNPYRQKIYEKYLLLYEKDKQARNVISLDDFIPLATSLLQRNKALLASYQKKYRYFFVDEFQDTNHSQFQFFRTLTSHSQFLNFVGDANQAIYSWRGSDRNLMVKLKKYYPNLKTITLLQNYRSTNNVIETANKVLADPRYFAKVLKLITTKQQKHKLEMELYIADNENDELVHIVSRIKKLVTLYDYQFRDITILYRFNRQALPLEQKLVEAHIPYHKWGLNFLNYKIIQRCFEAYRFLCAPNDVNLWRSFLPLLPTFGEKTASKIIAYVVQKKGLEANWWIEPDVLAFCSRKQAVVLQKWFEIVQQCQVIMHAKEQPVFVVWQELSRFLTKSRFFLNFCSQKDFGSLAWNNIQMQYVQYHNAAKKPRFYNWDFHRYMTMQNICADQMAEYRKEGVFVDFFMTLLDNLMLESGEHEAVTSDHNQVQLMTVHKAKGTENKIIMLFTLCEGVFPAGFKDTDLNEEARLFYVAITRAQHNVYLSYPAKIMKWDGTMRKTKQSQFLKYLSLKKIRAGKTIKSVNHSFVVNDLVYNETYLTGRIKRIMYHNCIVDFDNYGIRTVSINSLQRLKGNKHEYE